MCGSQFELWEISGFPQKSTTAEPFKSAKLVFARVDLKEPYQEIGPVQRFPASDPI